MFEQTSSNFRVAHAVSIVETGKGEGPRDYPATDVSLTLYNKACYLSCSLGVNVQKKSGYLSIPTINTLHFTLIRLRYDMHIYFVAHRYLKLEVFEMVKSKPHSADKWIQLIRIYLYCYEPPIRIRSFDGCH